MSEHPPASAQIPPDVVAPGRAIVMVGAPGAGKSTIGRLVAQRLGVGFIDVDARIEQLAGKPVAEIFADDGEPAFRAMEHHLTLESLGAGGVVALGGGAVLDPDIRAALTRHLVVWLQVSVTHASRRVGMNQARPLLLGNVRARLIQLLAERTPLYAQVATIVVDSDVHKPNGVADIVIHQLARHGVTVPQSALETKGSA